MDRLDTKLVKKLSRMSVADRYNPWQAFDWPALLPDDTFWMSPSLLSVAARPRPPRYRATQLISLSRWESIPLLPFGCCQPVAQSYLNPKDHRTIKPSHLKAFS